MGSRFLLRPMAAMLIVALGVGSIIQRSWKARAQVRPIYSSGAAGLGQLLKRLQTTASAVLTGAHPDDEDSGLIARLARGDQARVAYLALNRGEGGQNIIGPDLFEPLGVIRTEELLQARRLDGGEQLFTRTMDYGFSKTRDEAAQKWGEREVLSDMVRAIRIYRPYVVVSRFSGTTADGHGQHQLAGYLTPIAFRAASDPTQFPEQLAEGLRPWQPKKLYVGEGFRASAGNSPSLRIPTGEFDPLIGRSFFEIAMEGRSQHKSQEMGVLELRGPQSSGIRFVDGSIKPVGAERNLFDGIDTSIVGIANVVGLRSSVITGDLIAIQDAAARALAAFDAFAPHKTIAPLAEGLNAVRNARSKLASGNEEGEARADADFILSIKEGEFAESLQRAAGVVVDAIANRETIASGESLSVSVKVFLPSTTNASAGEITVSAPNGWRVEKTAEPTQSATQGFRPTRESAQASSFFKLTAPPDSPMTQPYWLVQPRQGAMFRWPEGSAKNRPFDPPVLMSRTKLEIGGVEVEIKTPVQFRFADDIRGEIRRDINVVPTLSLGLDSRLIIAPASPKVQRHRVAVTVSNNSQSATSGSVKLGLPGGWGSSPASASFALTTGGEHMTAFFDIAIPAGAAGGDHSIHATAESGGKTYDQVMHTVAYPHIQMHRYYTRAEIAARVFDLKVAPVSVGYVMGSGDEMPDAIKRMGLDLTMLGEKELASGNLARFNVIVIGVYATKVRPDWISNNNRLLDYVRNGGTLVVQYQRPDYLALKLAPFPAEMSARVTDETAKITILEPRHQAFNWPNKITDLDFDGWVQERSLYNFTTFDPRYTPLLESHDAGEPPQTGGEVYATLGRGKFVYTSYAWFRQLPSGVPGAYRLFANLLSLGKTPSASTAAPKTSR